MKTAAAALLIWILAVPADAEQACRLVRQASVDMSFDAGGAVTVPMTISGQKVSMLVDTGGTTSLLSDKLVDALKLNRLPINRRMWVEMFGGYRLEYYAEPKNIDLGGLHADSMTALIVPANF